MPYSKAEIHTAWVKCDRRCVYGQRRAVRLRDYSKTWEIEHAMPPSRGGVDDLRNWRVACIKHNRQKGDRTRQEYEQYLRTHPEDWACD